jgi:hypothetical protein
MQIDERELEDDTGFETQTLEFTMTVSVYDPEQLYAAACARWEADGNGEGRDEELRPGGEIDVASCLQMLADPGESWPGTSIETAAVDVLRDGIV